MEQSKEIVLGYLHSYYPEPTFTIENGSYSEGNYIFQLISKDATLQGKIDIGVRDQTPSKIELFENGIEIEEYYVVSWASALKIMEERFIGYEINQLNGMGYKFEGEEKVKMYYTFEVKKSGSSEVEYYLVKRDTGEIFIGAFDETYPDFVAVPVSPLE